MKGIDKILSVIEDEVESIKNYVKRHNSTADANSSAGNPGTAIEHRKAAAYYNAKAALLLNVAEQLRHAQSIDKNEAHPLLKPAACPVDRLAAAKVAFAKATHYLKNAERKEKKAHQEYKACSGSPKAEQKLFKAN